MGIYIIFLYGGNSFMSLISGFVIDGMRKLLKHPEAFLLTLSTGAGWRWFCWLCAIIAGLNFLAIFFFVPETRFDRASFESTTNSDSEDVALKEGTQAIERVNETLQPASLQPSTGIKKNFLQNLSLWSGRSQESFFSHFMRPYLLGMYPAVFWATISCENPWPSMDYGEHDLKYSILDSLVLAWQIASNTLSSFIFQLPPYNFSPGINSLINIPALCEFRASISHLLSTISNIKLRCFEVKKAC